MGFSGLSLTVKGVSQQEFDRLIRLFGITEKRSIAAVRRALDKTATWLKKEASKGIARETQIPIKVLRKRLLSYRTSPKLMRSKVFFGLRLIDAEHMGAPRRQKAGVKAGKHFFPGAFLGSVYSPTEKIWIRKTSKHYDPNLYPHSTDARSNTEFLDQEGGRFPLVKARIKTDEAESIFVEWVAKAEGYLARLINKELNLEIKKIRHAA